MSLYPGRKHQTSAPPESTSRSPQTPRAGAPLSIALLRPGPGAPEPRYCRRPRRCRDPTTGGSVLTPCGRPKCSRQCQDKWARKHAAVLARVLAETPATYFVRMTPQAALTPQELKRCAMRFIKALKRRLRAQGCEWWLVYEQAERL